MVKLNDQKLGKKEIDDIFKRGKTVQGSFFFIKAHVNVPQKRYAIIISKNISKKSVERTTMRRRLRHVIVDILKRYDAIDMIFILTRSILRKPHIEIKS